MTTAVSTPPRLRGVHPVVALLHRLRHVTRRDVQVALGVLWLLDGALQAKPFMFTRQFAEQVIAPVGQGQPGVVSGPVQFVATALGAHPVALNLLAVVVQLLLGVGLLLRRTARLAIIVSIVWALGVWYLSEGLGGLASGQASLLTGAPGAALLYAVIAAAAWPKGASDQPPARWLLAAWALLWVGGAALQLLPAQNSGTAVANLLTANADQGPHWLTWIDTSAGDWASHNGTLAVSGLVAVEFLVGVGVLPRRTRTWALSVGLVLSIAIWVVGQDLGQLYSSQATDPNSAPLIALMAVALLAWSGERTVRPGSPTADPPRRWLRARNPSSSGEAAHGSPWRPRSS